MRKDNVVHFKRTRLVAARNLSGTFEHTLANTWPCDSIEKRYTTIKKPLILMGLHIFP